METFLTIYTVVAAMLGTVWCIFVCIGSVGFGFKLGDFHSHSDDKNVAEITGVMLLLALGIVIWPLIPAVLVAIGGLRVLNQSRRHVQTVVVKRIKGPPANAGALSLTDDQKN